MPAAAAAASAVSGFRWVACFPRRKDFLKNHEIRVPLLLFLPQHYSNATCIRLMSYGGAVVPAAADDDDDFAAYRFAAASAVTAAVAGEFAAAAVAHAASADVSLCAVSAA